MNNLHSMLLVAVTALVTIAIRFLPFLIWSGKRKTPAYILYLGKVLPPAIIGMLVVYCLKDVSFAAAPFGAPELIAGACVVFLQAWRRNSLISILGGTLIYMLLVQCVF